MSHSQYPRGAEWRQWDLHVHTPASFEWRGGKRLAEMTPAEKAASIDEMIKKLNDAEPAVFALMDYWTFDGWLALKGRLSQAGAPRLYKTVFPGIELRLVSPTQYRLNAHVIFSDDVSDQDLSNFKSALRVALINQPLSDECLVRLAREKIGEDLIKKLGLDPGRVASDAAVALMAGSKTAVVTTESYKQAIENVPYGKAVGFMPWDTNDGLGKADWENHYAYVIELMNSSPIFETRRQELWAAFVGIKTEANEKWFDAFHSALDETPRLAVSGSDAHKFDDYGKFPSDKITWIKADPTFLGLLQAIKEPAKRSCIGQRPQKLMETEENKTYFIDSLTVTKNPDSTISDHWLAGCELPLNSDLVAIIGNKGSGKSALADIIALLGNSRQKDHFSFLSNTRFRKKPGELAKHFTGTLKWRDGSTNARLLSQDPATEAVELVRYIPQAHFEKLCNDHVSGKSDVFEKELRAVIFSHTSPAIRQKALDFDQLIGQQESSFRDQLGEYRKELKKLNQEIEAIELQLEPQVKRSLQELLVIKQKQLDEHNKIAPTVELRPLEKLTPEQQEASKELEKISQQLKALETNIQASSAKRSMLAAKGKSIQVVRDRLRLLKRQYTQFEQETKADLDTLGLVLSKVVSLTIDEDPLNQLAGSLPSEDAELAQAGERDEQTKRDLLASQVMLKQKLNEPQLRYEQSVKAREAWEEKLRDLVGTIEQPDTLEGIKRRISQLDELPERLKERRLERVGLASEIFAVLDAQRKGREELFKPVQDVIESNSLIREGYKLQFQASLGGSIDVLASALFDLIKQNSGEFRGGEESYAAVRRIAEPLDLNIKDDVIKFVTELHDKIVLAARGNSGDAGISPILRVNKSASSVYDLLFGLSFLEPRYTLLFQDTQIEQLSPGQRGALLLIFYLLVDKWRNPIILDQPEENLDNETVVSLLVPVLNEAKKKRQIIMVTHNPNLAVVCDAEQVVFSSFNRNKKCTIQYIPGSIENNKINSHVVNVLEGTKPAFNNRKIKYH